MVIAYYMKKHQAGFQAAISHVRSCRPNVSPNAGFELQLRDYQSLLGLSEPQEKQETQTKQTKETN